MADLDFFKGGITIIVIGVIFFYLGFKMLKKKRLIENIPTSKIRSVAMGLVELKGKVIARKEDLIKSPFTNKDCVYYDYKIEKKVKTGKRSRWITIRKGQEGDYFYLQDDTGMVLVKTKGAEIDVDPSFEASSSLGRDPPKKVMSYLNNNDISWEGFLGANNTMKYTEHVIEPEQNLYVLGTASDNPFVEETTAQKGYEDVMIKKGKNAEFFFIADKSEKSLTHSYAWKVPLMIGGGGLLIVAGLAGILSFFGII